MVNFIYDHYNLFYNYEEDYLVFNSNNLFIVCCYK